MVVVLAAMVPALVMFTFMVLTFFMLATIFAIAMFAVVALLFMALFVVVVVLLVLRHGGNAIRAKGTSNTGNQQETCKFHEMSLLFISSIKHHERDLIVSLMCTNVSVRNN
ncbi:hypothetical protein GXY_02581 [Novacetimonas hansenii ATCC 23769]|uniref:Uncharacterized protein n=1 Tax=Novacetimonas hansenii ATCC 23769 TaxID=714995 RepID=D5QBM2_NOVHA|nr:hypothetical protein GXY_02581 [Novacetimonas hansenii ATCC 23769]